MRERISQGLAELSSGTRLKVTSFNGDLNPITKEETISLPLRSITMIGASPMVIDRRPVGHLRAKHHSKDTERI